MVKFPSSQTILFIRKSIGIEYAYVFFSSSVFCWSFVLPQFHVMYFVYILTTIGQPAVTTEVLQLKRDAG